MFTVKSVVLYKNQPALITEVGDKYTIEYATNSGKKKTETQKVRDKDIILLHGGQVNSILDVIEAANFLQNQKESLNNALLEAYELLDDETQKTSFDEIAGLIRDGFAPKESWAIYSFLKNSPQFEEIIENSNIFFKRRSQSEIDSIVQKQKEKEGEQEIKTAFLKRIKAKKIQLPEDSKFLQEIEAFALGKTNKSKILKECGISETEEKAHKLLLDVNFWPYYKNPYPMRWGLSTQSASEKLISPPQEERWELDTISYAIDNSWSNDPDDAIAFDGKYVWVHIADPASTVVKDSSIDIAARNRGATLYLPEGAARMLSEECLEDYALGLKDVSQALSFRLLLDENGSIEETSVFKTKIKVKRLTYEEADNLKDTPELKCLFEIAERNIKKREKTGCVNINLPEVHIKANFSEKNSEPTIEIEEIKNTTASSVVREFMLLAGEGAARFAFKNNIPFPFVSQDSSDIPKDLPQGLARDYKLRRSMRPRSVGVTPAAHAGLGLGMYSQVTSPLRRYSDLIAHQQLRAFLDGKDLIDKDTLLERISAGDAAASASIKAERKSNLHWTLCFLFNHKDWCGDGVVVEYRDKKATVLIPSLGLETQIICPQVALNEIIKVKVSKIDIPTLTVDFVQQN